MKLHKKNKEFIEKVIILILIFFLVLSVGKIGTQIHNIDLVYNSLKVANKLNINSERITDTGSDFVTRPLTDYYISSINYLIKYLLISIFISLLIGLLIGVKDERNKGKIR